MSDNLELDRVTEKREAPAKAWKLRWGTTRPEGFSGYCCTCEAHHSEKEGRHEVDSCATYPSYEIAAQKALDFMRKLENPALRLIRVFPAPTP